MTRMRMVVAARITQILALAPAELAQPVPESPQERHELFPLALALPLPRPRDDALRDTRRHNAKVTVFHAV